MVSTERLKMSLSEKQKTDLPNVIEKLEKDRAWLLEQIDRGNWPKLREDLAALERDLGQMLTKVSDLIDDNL